MPGPSPAVISIIPARLASQRFPGKVLASETGKPLIRHVWESASRATLPTRVVIATDESQVAGVCRGFGAECVMTRADHPNGSSRLAEACEILNLPADAVVVNVQGDEPEIDAGLIDAAAEMLLNTSADVSTIASPMRDDEDAANPNVVKVVLARDGRALYFSRAMIPHDRDGSGRHASQSGSMPPVSSAPAKPLRHVGLYAYRRRVLAEYVRLPESPLEVTEKLEQLRLLENGYSIMVAVREARHAGIDTPEQYAEFVKRWRAKH